MCVCYFLCFFVCVLFFMFDFYLFGVQSSMLLCEGGMCVCVFVCEGGGGGEGGRKGSFIVV